jgi:UDP-N-acetylglucosamine 4,6-dehydratase
LVILSRDELKQYEMSLRFPRARYPAIRFFIGDVRDADRLRRAFAGIETVFHTAALKQVPSSEYNPTEAIHTNIGGAENVIAAAIDCGVKKVIALSTDKAANPINLYGATKLCSDKLFVAGNAYSGGVGPQFSVVRYGNVLGSRGSVVDLFLSQRKKGRLTVTDERMTRFWIWLKQGVDFVIDCLGRMNGGELFVPKIPSSRVVDLARTIAPDCEIEYVGIRPGEKLHEVMIPREDARRAYEFDDHYVIAPSFDWQGGDTSAWTATGKPCDEDFEYRSDTNPLFCPAEKMRELMAYHLGAPGDS